MKPSWCEITKTSNLHSTAQSFISSLITLNNNAFLQNPDCHRDGTWNYTHPHDDTVPPMTIDESNVSECINFDNSLNSKSTVLETMYFKIFPPLLSMTELWIRFFAFFASPLVLCYLIQLEFFGSLNHQEENIKTWKICLFGLCCAWIVASDLTYIMEYGHNFGLSILVLYSLLFFKYRMFKYKMMEFFLKISFLYIAFKSYYINRDINEKELPQFDEGLYYSKTNERMTKIVQAWPEASRDYSKQATFYLNTGDARTGIPFVMNSIPMNFNFTRIWVRTSINTEESIALDIAFSNIHDSKKPIYFLLHGLNGGSNEGYIREFTRDRMQEGHTVIVFIARGLMDTPVNGWNVFNGARITDVHDALRVVKNSIPKSQSLIAAGYSMGAIILGNYMTRCSSLSEGCLLDGAVSVSGGLDMRENLYFERSKKLWQPLLADELRNTIMKKFCLRYRTRLGPIDFLNFLRSTSISEIDEYAVVKYNGYKDILQYYSEMSAMGDFTSFNQATTPRLASIPKPYLVLHALDDPLITWKTVMKYDPSLLVEMGNGNLIMLLTNAGGHVGWPISLLPKKYGWSWMNTIVRDFGNAIDSTK